MIETALATLLLADATVAGLIGDRIGPMPLVQADGETAQVPAVTYQRISIETPRHLRGRTGTAKLRIQFDCWAGALTDVRALATAVRRLLDCYSGTVDGVPLEAVFLKDGGGDEYEPDTKLRRVQMDFSITCQEGDA